MVNTNDPNYYRRIKQNIIFARRLPFVSSTDAVGPVSIYQIFLGQLHHMKIRDVTTFLISEPISICGILAK